MCTPGHTVKALLMDKKGQWNTDGLPNESQLPNSVRGASSVICNVGCRTLIVRRINFVCGDSVDPTHLPCGRGQFSVLLVPP